MPFIMTRAHGNAVVAEHPADGHLLQVNGRPYTDVTGMPTGEGKVFRGASAKDSWFRLPVPTVDWLNEARLYLDDCFVLFDAPFRADGAVSAAVDQIHIWDGSARIFTFNPPNVLAGDWKNPREATNEHGVRFGNGWAPRIRAGAQQGQRFFIHTGLGISLHVFWAMEGNITFHSAGARWVDTPT